MDRADGIADHLRRALLLVALANEGGYSPTADELDAYATNAEPIGGVRTRVTITGLASLAGVGGAYTLTAGDPVADYLLAVRWVTRHDGGLKLTDLGEGLVVGMQGSDAASRSTQPQGVVLQPEDPAVWTVLTREVARAGPGLLADPYFRDEHLEWLAQTTSISRLMTSKRGHNASTRGLLELELGRLIGEGSAIEVRITSDASFHDRYLEHADGQIHLVGASINGIGRNLTTIMPAPPAAQGALRTFLADLWRDAEPLAPRYGIKRASEGSASL